MTDDANGHLAHAASHLDFAVLHLEQAVALMPPEEADLPIWGLLINTVKSVHAFTDASARDE